MVKIDQTKAPTSSVHPAAIHLEPYLTDQQFDLVDSDTLETCPLSMVPKNVL